MVSRFYDTNVLLYAVMANPLPKDAHKKPITLTLIAQGNFAVSGQVLAEFYHVVTTKGRAPMPQQEALAWLEDLRQLPVVAIDADVVEMGAQLSARYQISYWDAAVLAAAQVAGCHSVYSEDLSHDQLYGNVRVINPFVAQ